LPTDSTTYSLTVKASTKHLAKVRNFVAKHAQKAGFQEAEIADIRLAVDEAYTNIIKHAYHYDDSREVDIAVEYGDDEFCISIFDDGEPFDMDTYEMPDVAEKIKQKKRGGVGVYLISKLMDQVEYLHDGDGLNEIRMIKNR
jgi:serine/threonine-protein kinase RsbW